MKFIFEKAFDEIKGTPFLMLVMSMLIGAMLFGYFTFARADEVNQANKDINESIDNLSTEIKQLRTTQLIPNIIMIHKQYCDATGPLQKQRLLQIYEEKQREYKRLEFVRYPVEPCKANQE